MIILGETFWEQVFFVYIISIWFFGILTFIRARFTGKSFRELSLFDYIFAFVFIIFSPVFAIFFTPIIVFLLVSEVKKDKAIEEELIKAINLMEELGEERKDDNET